MAIVYLLIALTSFMYCSQLSGETMSSMFLNDERTGCLSGVVETTYGEYLSFAESIYKDSGGIEGQRSPLRTKTGIRIRQRMVADISEGAILPPLVVGVICGDDEFEEFKGMSKDQDLIARISKKSSDELSIIDGIQRTTAILEASNKSDISRNPVRLEVWISKKISSLIYRMLVLNTGQVPWDMRRQLETIYKPMLREVQSRVETAKIIEIGDGERRKAAGEYQGNKIVELFLVFTSRKVNIDLKDKVAEDFARMDATEAAAQDNFIEHFSHALSFLCSIDTQLSRYVPDKDSKPEGKISSGKDIFQSSPAAIGFTAACAVTLFGAPGFDKDSRDISSNIQSVEKKVEAFNEKLANLSHDELGVFLDLLTLNEKLGRRSGKVGEFERAFFFDAFITLLKYGDELSDMTPCWLAH